MMITENEQYENEQWMNEDNEQSSSTTAETEAKTEDAALYIHVLRMKRGEGYLI